MFLGDGEDGKRDEGEDEGRRKHDCGGRRVMAWREFHARITILSWKIRNKEDVFCLQQMKG